MNQPNNCKQKSLQVSAVGVVAYSMCMNMEVSEASLWLALGTETMKG